MEDDQLRQEVHQLRGAFNDLVHAMTGVHFAQSLVLRAILRTSPEARAALEAMDPQRLEDFLIAQAMDDRAIERARIELMQLRQLARTPG